MKRLLPLLAWAFVPILVTNAPAQTDDGCVGIYRDSLGTQACASVPPYTSVTLYVIARTSGGSANGITGAEFRIEVTSPSGWYLSYIPPGTASIVMGNPIDIDPDPNAGGGLNLGFPSCQVPDGNGRVKLGSLSVFNASGSPTNLLVKRHSHPSNAGFASPVFVECDAPYYTKVRMTASPPDSCTLGTQKASMATADDPAVFTASLNGEGSPDGGEAVPPERQVLASFRAGIVQLPQGQTKATRVQTTITGSEIASVVDAYGVETIEKAFPNFTLADTLGTTPTGEAVRLANLSEIYALSVPVGGNTLGLANDLSPLDGVGYAEQNGVVAQATTTCSYGAPCPLTLFNCPDDLYFMSQQWGLVNRGQTGGTCGADIEAHEAWRKLQELGDLGPGDSNTKIAILDWGIEANHDDMSGKVSGDLGWSDSHGTHVAGIAAAKTDNTNGIAGVDWDAQIVSRRIDVAGNIQQLSDIVRNAASSDALVRILNSSWIIWTTAHDPLFSTTLRLAFRDVYMMDRVQTVAMGNTTNEHPSRSTVWYPAAFGQGQITVAAMNEDNLSSTFSLIGSHVDVAAPGQDILSSVPGSAYGFKSGTSMAAPHVAGLAGLLYAAKPWLDADDVRQIIRMTATDMSISPATPGNDIYTGTGRINAGQAVNKLLFPNELRHVEVVGGTQQAQDWQGDVIYAYPPSGADANTRYLSKRFPVERDVTFPIAFQSTPVVWGRGAHTIGYSTDGSTTGFPPVNYGMGWCEPVPGTITTTGCRMRTWIYRVYNVSGEEVAQAPTSPANVKFAFSVLGEATLTDTQPGDAMAGGFALSIRNPIVGPGILNLRLAKAAAVRMEIFDVAGRSVKILHNGQFTAGQHELRWDTQDERGLDLPSGLYFVRVRVGEANQVRKIVLLQ